MEGIVSRLTIYPVKSCAPVHLSSMVMDAFGPVWDRRYMVVDASGQFMTARKYPRMLRIQPALAPDGIWLQAPGMPDCFVPWTGAGDGASGTVNVWRDSLVASEMGQSVAAWFSRYLETPCRLVFASDPSRRQVDRQWFDGEHAVSFADGFPVLLVSQGSLADLNARMGKPLEMARFRANIEVEGFDAFAEDGWKKVQVGGVTLQVCKPCSRCVLTTINPATLERGVEPLQSLATYRRQEGGVMFGQNAVPLTGGMIVLGDKVVPC